MTFAEKLTRLRKSQGYSQEDLADKLNVTRQAVYKWESGAAMPDAYNLREISVLFNVSMDVLMSDDDNLGVTPASQSPSPAPAPEPVPEPTPAPKPAPAPQPAPSRPRYGKVTRSKHTLNEVDIESDNTKLSNHMKKLEKIRNIVLIIAIALFIILLIIAFSVDSSVGLGFFIASIIVLLLAIIFVLCYHPWTKHERSYFFSEKNRIEGVLKEKKYWYIQLQYDMLAWFFYDYKNKTFGFYYLNEEQFVCPIQNYSTFVCNSYGAGMAPSGTSVGVSVVGGSVRGVGMSAHRKYRNREATNYSFSLHYFDSKGRTSEYAYELNCTREYTSKLKHSNLDTMRISVNACSKSTNENFTKMHERLEAEKNKLG